MPPRAISGLARQPATAEPGGGGARRHGRGLEGGGRCEVQRQRQPPTCVQTRDMQTGLDGVEWGIPAVSTASRVHQSRGAGRKRSPAGDAVQGYPPRVQSVSDCTAANSICTAPPIRCTHVLYRLCARGASTPCPRVPLRHQRPPTALAAAAANPLALLARRRCCWRGTHPRRRPRRL